MSKAQAKTQYRQGVNKRVQAKSKRKRRVKLTSTQNLKNIERRRKVIIMRREGWEVQEIADAIGCSEVKVREDLAYCLNLAATQMSETAVEERELQKARLNMLLKPNLQFATQPHKEIVVDKRTGAQHVVEVPPDPAYATVVLKIEERRSRLLALDIPEVKKMEVSGIREYLGVDMDQV